MTKEERKIYDAKRYQAKKAGKWKAKKKAEKPAEGMPAMENGKLMSVEKFCKKYGIDFATVKNARPLLARKHPTYSLTFHPFGEKVEKGIDYKKEIKKALKNVEIKKHNYKGGDEITINIADLHGGAYIDGLRHTPDFSLSILIQRLEDIAQRTNGLLASKVHVNILGDLIESFSGLNHKNSWKGLAKGMHGVEIVKFMVKILHEHFLDKIVNLASVHVVGGNHDRISHDKAVDNEGGAAELIVWGLNLIGYDAKFDSLVTSYVVDGIGYIGLHGDKGLSRRKAKEIIHDYGSKEVDYHVIIEGHFHSLTTKEDSHNCVRIGVRSLFTGNAFSEELGYTSTAGFSVVKNNGGAAPDIFHFSLK